jgi:hypothetical protein
MSYAMNRVNALRAGPAMAAPGSGTNLFGSGGNGSNGVAVGVDVSGNASVQATGMLIIALVVLVVIGERVMR